MPPRPSPDFAQIRMKTYLNHKYIIACPLSHCLFQFFRPAAGSVLWAGSVAPPFCTTRYPLCCCNMSFCRSFSFTSRDFTAYANSEFTPAKRRIFVFFFRYVCTTNSSLLQFGRWYFLLFMYLVHVKEAYWYI